MAIMKDSWIKLFPSFCRWENWGSERSCDLPGLTHLVSSQVGTRPRFSVSQFRRSLPMPGCLSPQEICLCCHLDNSVFSALQNILWWQIFPFRKFFHNVSLLGFAPWGELAKSLILFVTLLLLNGLTFWKAKRVREDAVTAVLLELEGQSKTLTFLPHFMGRAQN